MRSWPVDQKIYAFCLIGAAMGACFTAPQALAKDKAEVVKEDQSTGIINQGSPLPPASIDPSSGKLPTPGFIFPVGFIKGIGGKPLDPSEDPRDNSGSVPGGAGPGIPPVDGVPSGGMTPPGITIPSQPITVGPADGIALPGTVTPPPALGTPTISPLPAGIPETGDLSATGIQASLSPADPLTNNSLANPGTNSLIAGPMANNPVAITTGNLSGIISAQTPGPASAAATNQLIDQLVQFNDTSLISPASVQSMAKEEGKEPAGAEKTGLVRNNPVQVQFVGEKSEITLLGQPAGSVKMNSALTGEPRKPLLEETAVFVEKAINNLKIASKAADNALTCFTRDLQTNLKDLGSYLDSKKSRKQEKKNLWELPIIKLLFGQEKKHSPANDIVDTVILPDLSINSHEKQQPGNLPLNKTNFSREKKGLYSGPCLNKNQEFNPGVISARAQFIDYTKPINDHLIKNGLSPPYRAISFNKSAIKNRTRLFSARFDRNSFLLERISLFPGLTQLPSLAFLLSINRTDPSILFSFIPTRCSVFKLSQILREEVIDNV